jgi:Transposase DDE domain
LAIVRALPMGVRPVVLADRGFHRAGFIAWLERHHLNYVVRISKGSCITEATGRRWKMGEEGLKIGELRFVEGVRYGLYHGRPPELSINVALCWRITKSRATNPRCKQPEEPWYLATSLKDAKMAASWYWQRVYPDQHSSGRWVCVGCFGGTLRANNPGANPPTDHGPLEALVRLLAWR